MATKILNRLRKVRDALAFKKRIEDHYEVKEEIGRGMCSVVMRGIHKKTREEVALKFIEKDCLESVGLERENIITEIEILRNYPHPYIVPLRDVYEDRRKYVLVFECLKGELHEKVKEKPLSEKEAAVVIKKMMEVLVFLHRNGIAHRDLKLENLLLFNLDDPTSVILADFGLAKHVGELGTMNTPCGSQIYFAPEISREEKYGISADIWSIGIILYVLLSGTIPFQDENSLREGKFSFPDSHWRQISPQAKNLISCLLRVEPCSRLTAIEVLKSPWIQLLAPSTEDFIDFDSPEFKERLRPKKRSGRDERRRIAKSVERVEKMEKTEKAEKSDDDRASDSLSQSSESSISEVLM